MSALHLSKCPCPAGLEGSRAFQKLRMSQAQVVETSQKNAELEKAVDGLNAEVATLKASLEKKKEEQDEAAKKQQPDLLID